MEEASARPALTQASSATGIAGQCVSVIVPVHNCCQFLDDAFGSLLHQTFLEEGGVLEVSIYDDDSTVSGYDAAYACVAHPGVCVLLTPFSCACVCGRVARARATT